MPGMFQGSSGSQSGQPAKVIFGSKPSAPTISSITSLNQGATVNITAPSNLGNRSLLKYVVQFSDGSLPSDGNAGSPSTSHGITGLVNGTSYSFVVYAVNEFGMSQPSAPVSVVPAAPYIPKGCEGTWVGAPGTCFNNGYNYGFGNMLPNTYFGTVSCSDGMWTMSKAKSMPDGSTSDFSVTQNYAPC